ncbi:hypothetical protein [Pseudomonas amygdali]|uniref:Uncharacterized protein n=1 Tax=Pseudomonas amygdali pv. lachrymans str. M301315 TaxID=629260 RepID=A0AAD0V9D7_PSEAV|nr:hypothetical protein [Pseudomonas amygdali]AXH59781.1 hypothetical protein PLA107_031655 [Pseudomonas amygdali pv. lachrymans str. M301315]RMT05722.1 hypothetical protein ALP54_03675 [Pseudomonas amygdali pv. lachrymans]
MVNSDERLNAHKCGNPVHVRSNEIMQEHIAPLGLTEEQLNVIYATLQLSWNSGYKAGYEAAVES